MSASLYEAHCHTSEAPRGAYLQVVNGTSPEDWRDVIAMAAKNPQVIAAIGLHPWKVAEAPGDWQTQFLALIGKAGAVGEIGLDRWIEGHDIEQQEAAFGWQLAQAAERNLPVSIHCLKASDALLHCLKANTLPARGIHLHAYSGSAEQVAQFAELGAYFSFHAGQFMPNAKQAPAAVQVVPANRLLIETDAPDTLEGDDEAAFLHQGYERIAELRGVSVDALAEQVADNFTRYYIND